MNSIRRGIIGKYCAFIAIGLIGTCSSGCGRRPVTQDSPPKSVRAVPERATREYKLVGEVRKIDRASGELTIRHEAIEGFMGAMTMPFRVAPSKLPEDLQPEDRVEGRLRVDYEGEIVADYRLEGLVVTRPAMAQPKVLDLAGSSPELKVRPQRLQTGEKVPDFTLTGQDGRPFKLSDLRGDVVVLTFIYTRCPLPDFCPAMDRRFSTLAQSIAAFPDRARRIRLISISFDPDHDTPDVLKKHAEVRGAMPPLWIFAVASHAELGRIAGPLGLVYGPGKNEIIHNLCTAVVDPDGNLARLEVGTRQNAWTGVDMLKSIYSLLRPIPAR